MTRPIVKEHNIETDEVIEREMNDAEFTQWEIDQEIDAKRKADAEAKTAARAELLAKLGITEEQAKLLII